MTHTLRDAAHPGLGWEDIDGAPYGQICWVFTAASDGLAAFQGLGAYHPDAGWCTDELRSVTHWHPEITKLLRDAARYRWLRDHGGSLVYRKGYRISDWFNDNKARLSITAFDAMIDAEIARERL